MTSEGLLHMEHTYQPTSVFLSYEGKDFDRTKQLGLKDGRVSRRNSMLLLMLYC